MLTDLEIYSLSDPALIQVFGKKIKSKRIAKRYSREHLALASGVAVSSIKNMENGCNVSLMTLIQVLRALQALDLLEPFWKEEPLDPIAIAEAQKKMRQPKRVRKSNSIPAKFESEW